jgi:hypothetical protein
VKLVTINLGAGYVLPLGGDKAAVEAGLIQIRQNLPVILAALREAAGPDVPIVGMNYYSPFVVAWFDDPALGHALVDATVQFNDGLEAIYTAAGSPVADVETAFSTTDSRRSGPAPGDLRCPERSPDRGPRARGAVAMLP